MQWCKAMSKLILMTRTGNDTKDDDMSTGTTIDDKGLEEEVDSSGIVTYDRVDLPSASSAIKKGTDAQTVRTRTELTLNFVHIVE